MVVCFYTCGQQEINDKAMNDWDKDEWSKFSCFVCIFFVPAMLFLAGLPSTSQSVDIYIEPQVCTSIYGCTPCSPLNPEGCCVIDTKSADDPIREAAIFDRGSTKDPTFWDGGVPGHSKMEFAKSEDASITSRCSASQHMKTIVLQHPIDDPEIPVLKSTSHTACWVKSPGADGESRKNAYDEKLARERWYHRQQWQQARQFDNATMQPAGWLIGILCAILSFSDFTANLVPETYPLKRKCDFQKIFRNFVCSCGTGFLQDREERKRQAIERGEKKIERKKSVQKEKKEAQAEARWADTCSEKCSGFCKKTVWIKILNLRRWMTGDGFDSNLFYALVFLPFNFLINSYTTVSHSFIANQTARADEAGLWELASEDAVKMIVVPWWFLTLLLIIAFGIAPLGSFLFLKYDDVDIGDYRFSEEFPMLCSFATLALSFLTWLGIVLFILGIEMDRMGNAEFSLENLVFGIPLPFDVPEISFPVAAFSFSYR